MKALVAALVVLPLVAGCAASATTGPTTSSAPTGPGGPATPSSHSTHGSTQHGGTSSGATFDRGRHSLGDPTSIWVIVNKRHPISPLEFRPRISIVRGYQVATPAAAPLTRMLDAADRAGVPLKIASAFRSYGYQEGVHSHLVATLGLQAADAISARPGYSEHQTGLAVDLQPLDGTCALQDCFAGTAAARWLTAHAWTFGFVVRYTRANSQVTGYSPEPWHFRYVGSALARELHETGIASLEQFFGVTGGDYPTGAGS
ncbi:MAG TPA: D-alanyl-D-alanine carboxypeptidase family protein [Nocardioides sp.]|nr:D-alanyl-D-alanine carboxypeptidase family protein [Nocardioides sp.]